MNKSLIAITTYCPDNYRKRRTVDLLRSLQYLRDKYDILLVGHSMVGENIEDLVNYSFYDSENTLLTDFDLTNGFFWTVDDWVVNTRMVYPNSTHLTVYRLIHSVLNLSKFYGYEKVHMIEYDLQLSNFDIIKEIDELLDDNPVVGFEDKNNLWPWGIYYAFNPKSINILPEYSDKIVIDQLRNGPYNHTEYINKFNLFKPHKGDIKYLDIDLLRNDKEFDIISSHKEKDWIVPVYDEKNNILKVFILNIGGEKQSLYISYNNKLNSIPYPSPGCYMVQDIKDNFDVEGTHSILFIVNNEIYLELNLNKDNFNSFKKYNNIL
tara:strand:+ start:675 stop:1640 length:966 start_codon:yes stop_codon:yes gene_type:complete